MQHLDSRFSEKSAYLDDICYNMVYVRFTQMMESVVLVYRGTVITGVILHRLQAVSHPPKVLFLE